MAVLIIYVCVDVKPISVIGVAHQLQLEDISRGFRNVPANYIPPEGLLAFIAKYLIDVSFLEDNRVQGPVQPLLPPLPPAPLAVPPIPPTAPDNVRAAHSLPGYDVELLELLPVEDEAPGMSSAVNQLENESK